MEVEVEERCFFGGAPFPDDSRPSTGGGSDIANEISERVAYTRNGAAFF